MSQFDLTDERQIQEMARAFTADAITPHAAKWDEEHIFPHDTIRAAAALGFGPIYLIAFSYPVVPKGRARIRTQISATYSREEFERAVAAFAEAGRELS